MVIYKRGEKLPFEIITLASNDNSLGLSASHGYKVLARLVFELSMPVSILIAEFNVLVFEDVIEFGDPFINFENFY